MGLLESLYETYNLYEKNNLVGVYDNVKYPLAPVWHAVQKANIEITIDKKGKFVNAERIDNVKDGSINPYTIYPVTESSPSRTSSPIAHPLCDVYAYVNSANGNKYTSYIEILQEWVDSEFTHEIPQAVLKYVLGGTIINDLSCLKKAPSNNDFIRWVVLGVDEPNCWMNHKLFDCYIKFMDKKAEKLPHAMCMVTGKRLPVQEKHMKISGYAKLISADMTTNPLKYFGNTFTSLNQICAISTEASQKSHLMLKYLMANYGVYFGGTGNKRIALLWSNSVVGNPDYYYDYFYVHNDRDELDESNLELKNDFKMSIYSDENISPSDKTIFAIFDSLSDGRYSLVEYSELATKQYIRNINEWNTQCKWVHPHDSSKEYTPSINEIIRYAIGYENNMGFVSVDGKNALQNKYKYALATSKLLNKQFPSSVYKMLFKNCIKASTSYNHWNMSTLISIFCAVVSRYTCSHDKEVNKNMGMDLNTNDRSFQFGRLIAVLEKEELDAVKNKTNKKDLQMTNALKQWANFYQKPLTTSNTVTRKIKSAYWKHLTPPQRIWYEKLESEIWNNINLSCDTEQLNKALNETYLLGYSLQKKEFYTKKTKEEKENENEQI